MMLLVGNRKEKTIIEKEIETKSLLMVLKFRFQLVYLSVKDEFDFF